MGKHSLEVYLAAEILQEFCNGGFEVVVNGLVGLGIMRNWACLLISFGWAWGFALVGWGFNCMGWKIRL